MKLVVHVSQVLNVLNFVLSVAGKALVVEGRSRGAKGSDEIWLISDRVEAFYWVSWTTFGGRGGGQEL